MNKQSVISILSFFIILGWSFFVFDYFLKYNFSEADAGFSPLVTSVQSRRGRMFNSSPSGQTPTTTGTALTQTPPQLPLDQSGYSETTSLSFNDILSSIADPLGSQSMETLSNLQREYSTSHDPNIGVKLISQYVQQYDYQNAYTIFQDLSSSTIYSMDPYLTMRVVLNSDLVKGQTQDFNTISNLVAELSANSLISQEDKQFYQSLITLLEGKKEDFLNQLPSYASTNSSPISILVNDLRHKVAQSTRGNDMPDSYSDGMIALVLFQYGYPTLAEELSLRILQQAPHYILPKQILAYSSIVLHHRKSAQSYFTQLIEQDPDNESIYQFFVGVSYYRMQDYTSALLYLNQSSQVRTTSDVVRYKILSYIALKDWTNAARSFQTLLDSTDIKSSDMILAWEQIVFIPLLTQQPYEILIKNSKILDYYVKVCGEQQIDRIICQLGQLAQDMVDHTTSFSENQLKDLAHEFPKSYVYVGLGDYYLKHGDKKDAQKSYISALSLSTDSQIKSNITEKIKTLL